MARNTDVASLAGGTTTGASESPYGGQAVRRATLDSGPMRRLGDALITLVLGAVLVALFRLAIAAENVPIAQLLPVYAVVLASYLLLVAVVGFAAAAILRQRSPSHRVKQRFMNSILGAPEARRG